MTCGHVTALALIFYINQIKMIRIASKTPKASIGLVLASTLYPSFSIPADAVDASLEM
jgi:hypothetical protein